MSDKAAWVGASGSQVLQHGYQAHANTAGDKITEIKEIIQSASASLGSVLENVEQYPEFADLVQPLDGVFNQMTERVSDDTLQSVRNCVDALVRTLQKFEADKKLQEADTTALRQELQRVRQELQRLGEDRRKVLLGQMAYTLDKAAREHVYGPKCEFMTLKDLVVFAETGSFTDTEAKRFKEFCTIIKDKCGDIGRLNGWLRPLRNVRCEPADGSVEEVTSVTAEQLRAWAGEFNFPPVVLSGVLPVLELFTEPGRPLVLRRSAPQAVQ